MAQDKQNAVNISAASRPAERAARRVSDARDPCAHHGLRMLICADYPF
jgi:hypothetical protein